MLDFQTFLKSLSSKTYNSDFKSDLHHYLTFDVDNGVLWNKFVNSQTFALNKFNYIYEKEGDKRFIRIPIEKEVDMISDFSIPENMELFLVLNETLIPIKNNFRFLTYTRWYHTIELRIYFPKGTKTIEFKYNCSLFNPSVVNFLKETPFFLHGFLYDGDLIHSE